MRIRRAMPDDRPTVCIGVVTGAPRVDAAAQILADLKQQTVPPDEVTVVIQRGMSADDPTAARDGLARGGGGLPLTILMNDGVGLSAARNLIVRRSQADVAVFMDDDARMPSDSIDVITNAYGRYPEAAALTFEVDWTGEGHRRTYPAVEMRRRTVRSLTSVASIEIAVSLRALRRLGVAFDEHFGLGAPFGTGEELVLLADLIRRGGDVRFIPAVVARHPARTSGSTLDAAMMGARGALFRRLYGGPAGLAIGLAYAARGAFRREFECTSAAAIGGIVGGWRRLDRRA